MSRVQNAYKNLPANYSNIPVQVPACARFNSMGAPVGGVIRDKYVSSTVSTAVTSGGLIRFEIPPSASEMLMPHKTFMQFTLRTKATDAANAAIVLSSGADVIRRLDLRVGGQQVSNISRYNRLYAAMKVANAPKNYIDTDGAISERMNVRLAPGAGADTYQAAGIQCHIPLLSGLFTTDRCIPLNLLTSPIVVTIELDTAGQISSDAGFELEVSNARLYHQTVDMGDAYNSALKAELGAMGLMRMSLVEFSGSEYTNQATVNVLLGENCSSLLGVICGTQVLPVSGKTGTVVDTPNTERYIVDGFTSSEFKLDSLQHPTYLIQGPHHAHTESQKLFSGIFDTNHTGSYGPITLTSVDVGTLDAAYDAGKLKTNINNASTAQQTLIQANLKDREFPANKFVHGISATRYHENTLSLVGSPVANHIQITKIATGAADSTFFVWTVKEVQAIIDASGTLSIAK